MDPVTSVVTQVSAMSIIATLVAGYAAEGQPKLPNNVLNAVALSTTLSALLIGTIVIIYITSEYATKREFRDTRIIQSGIIFSFILLAIGIFCWWTAAIMKYVILLFLFFFFFFLVGFYFNSYYLADYSIVVDVVS